MSEYKTLDIKLDKVNSYIPPIVVNEADNNGRRLKFTPTYEGQPVTGITSARMYYDPRPRDAASIGDYVDGTKDGDGWVFVIPPNTFTANVQGIASVSFTDTDGETYTRSMPIDVEPGGTKIDSQGTRIDRLIATLEQMVNDFTMTADAETGPAGSQASVNVTKLGNGSYKLDFTIPTGAQGPKGDPGDLTTVAHDATLTGNGTSGTPLGVNNFTTLDDNVDLNTVRTFGIFLKAWGRSATNTPLSLRDTQYLLLVNRAGNWDTSDVIQMIVPMGGVNGADKIYFRYFTNSTKWSDWKQLVTINDLSNYVPLSTYQALEAKVQALESKTKLIQITTNGTDIHTLFSKNGSYMKQWGTTVVNSPNSITNGTDSTYIITVVGNEWDGYMRIDPVAGFADSYYCQKIGGYENAWYKITATEVTA